MAFIFYLLFFLASGIIIPLTLWAISNSSVTWGKYVAVAVTLLAVFFSLRV